MDDDLLQLLEQTLHREIPLSQAMKFQVLSWHEERLSLQMPLEPNKNHQYSAFAGSLNALCTIVGWGTIFLLLAREGLSGNIVIRRGRIRYLRPVLCPEIVASSLAVDPKELEYFFELMRSKGQSKLNVSSQIVDSDGPLVRFEGSYVVHGR